jgi:hypothetical protein
MNEVKLKEYVYYEPKSIHLNIESKISDSDGQQVEAEDASLQKAIHAYFTPFEV